MVLRVVEVCAQSSAGAALFRRVREVFREERGKITMQASIKKRDAPRRGVNVRTVEQTSSFLVQCITFTLIQVRRDQARQLKEWSRRAGQKPRARRDRAPVGRVPPSIARLMTRKGVKLVDLLHSPSTTTTATTIMSSTSSAAATSASKRRKSMNDGEYGDVTMPENARRFSPG